MCTWCVAHPTQGHTGRILLHQQEPPKASEEPPKSRPGRPGPKVREEPPKAKDEPPKGRQGRQASEKKRDSRAARTAHQASADEYTVRSFLDAKYMFAHNVDRASAIIPAGGASLLTNKRTQLTYALHVLIDWDGTDAEGKPYKPTWEVADTTTLDGVAWRAFAAKKRRLTGNKNWSVADIPFKRNARPGKTIAQ